MAKKTIEEVREFIFQNSNGECELLSKEYENKKTPLKIRCRCGNVFERKWENLNKNFIQCKDCTNKHRSEKYSFSQEYIIDKINSTGCKYISGEYVNSRSLLTIQCRCGKIFKKDYCNFSAGADRCPDCGNENTRKSKIKYSLQDVKEKISERGYVLLEKEYLGAHEKMLCKCSQGHEFYLVFSQYLKGCSGCQICSWKKNSGKGHVFYKNGESKVTDALRDSVDGWRNNLLQIYNNKCPITGSSDVVTHHLYPFAKILKECSLKTGVPILKRIGDYKDYEDFAKLKESVVEYHWENDIGIVISKELHDLFHNAYGDKDNTIEQFDEFLKEKYNINLKDVLVKTIK
jgi:hypothetical protein